MWMAFTQLGGTIGGKETAECYVNMTLVRMIVPGQKPDDRTKIVFMDGQTIQVTESYKKVKSMLDGSLEKSYRAPEPKGG